ncbi:MAG: tRNA (adenosine(37)-N6)-dimethylallyltransferase MiaA [Alphaproteobacteria bacterium]|nr:tRNA (adenosine(37)-N6)-dimethylallyltransferase MiaA [Alphaproteobacteria bacterium]
MPRVAIFIAGPTASGKSAVAMAVAEALAPHGGAGIINADSMQVYRELRVLTARPGDDDLARVPHHLYGAIAADERFSAMVWRDLAMAAIESCWQEGRVPLVVGGSGLYFKALIAGLAPIPVIDPSVRSEARRLVETEGPEAIHAKLRMRDPEAAARIRPGDRQRVARAWEVIAATGIPLSTWQRQPGDPFPGTFLGFVLDPPREVLDQRIAERFAGMIAGGAIEEVRRLEALDLPPIAPLRRAVGVAEIAAHLRGEHDLATAISLGARASRQLAKRQGTWFRNQMSSWDFESQQIESFLNKNFPKILKSLLT